MLENARMTSLNDQLLADELARVEAEKQEKGEKQVKKKK